MRRQGKERLGTETDRQVSKRMPIPTFNYPRILLQTLCVSTPQVVVAVAAGQEKGISASALSSKQECILAEVDATIN